MIAITAFAALAWAYLLAFHGRFWRADQRLPPPASADEALASWPDVVAVIPARNEAAQIADVVAAHIRTDYPGRFELIVVDDASTDGTADLVRRAAQDGSGRRGAPQDDALVPPVHLETAPPLAPGWSGKLWAVSHGLNAADARAPDARYVLLTDADIVHAPDTLRRLVAMAETGRYALVSLMARLDSRAFWGGLLAPAFVFFFQKLYPFPLANRPAGPVAAAAGGCMLLRRDALAQIGGVAAIKDALIDDCALAAQIKRGPPARAIWLGLADREVVSLRDNRDLASFWKMVARTAFTQLKHSALLLAGAVIGMTALYLVPPAALLWGAAGGDLGLAALGAAAMAAMATAYAPTLALYGQGPARALALPLAAALYTAMTVSSALRHWRGAGGAWKGRTYP